MRRTRAHEAKPSPNRSLRLVVQDTALSRRRQGFESPRERHPGAEPSCHTDSCSAPGIGCPSPSRAASKPGRRGAKPGRPAGRPSLPRPAARRPRRAMPGPARTGSAAAPVRFRGVEGSPFADASTLPRRSIASGPEARRSGESAGPRPSAAPRRLGTFGAGSMRSAGPSLDSAPGRRDHTLAPYPPSRSMVSAVMNRPSSDARKSARFAASSGRPGPSNSWRMSK